MTAARPEDPLAMAANAAAAVGRLVATLADPEVPAQARPALEDRMCRTAALGGQLSLVSLAQDMRRMAEHLERPGPASRIPAAWQERWMQVVPPPRRLVDWHLLTWLASVMLGLAAFLWLVVR